MAPQCPLWSTYAHIKEDDSGKTVASHRAGGLYRPDASTEPKLAQLTPEEKGDLSYGIYQHNRKHRLFERLWQLVGPDRGWPEEPDAVLAHQPVDLDEKHVEYLLAQRPTTEKRILGYMQELVRQQAQARPKLIALPVNLGNEMDLLQAASGCREKWGKDELAGLPCLRRKTGVDLAKSFWGYRGSSGWSNVRG